MKIGEDNGGELQVPDSVNMSQLIEAANENDVPNAPIDIPSDVRDDDTPPKYVAKDVVEKIRHLRNLIHPAHALRKKYDPRTFMRGDLETFKETTSPFFTA